MRRYVLTGTPGAGKSSLLRVLQQHGFPVVAEAATDVIAAAQAAGVSGEPTAARRISFEDSLGFEALHEEVYCSFGYELVNVEPAAVTERADWIIEHQPHAFRQRRDGIAGLD